MKRKPATPYDITPKPGLVTSKRKKIAVWFDHATLAVLNHWHDTELMSIAEFIRRAVDEAIARKLGKARAQIQAPSRHAAQPTDAEAAILAKFPARTPMAAKQKEGKS